MDEWSLLFAIDSGVSPSLSLTSRSALAPFANNSRTTSIDGPVEDGVAQSLERCDVGEVKAHFGRAACPVVDGGHD